jgi:hypothetical protein
MPQKELSNVESPNSSGDATPSNKQNSAPEPGAVELPDRYSIREESEQRELRCSESPTLSVKIDRGMTVPSGTAHKAQPGTIYLDGAAEGGPFLDVEKAIFNLDHHEGCVRSFTLATCEQALVLIRKGMDLQARDWTIHANDPDLDTILAIWLLLNHMRINDVDPEIRKKIVPFVRLQGSVDAHGLEMQELCGFPAELQASVFAQLEKWRSNEVALKKEGKWQDIDFLEYTAEVLRAIDAIIYSSHHFEGVIEVKEMARVDIGENHLAIVCQGDVGIYEVESQLRRLHGKRLGVIILKSGRNTYTLRQVETFLPATLENAYLRLNLIDPAAGSRRSGNRWGGSAEIGGSPRATGTALTPRQIAKAIGEAYRGPTRGQRLRCLANGILGNVAVVVASMMSTYYLANLHDPSGSLERYFRGQAGTYAGVLGSLTVLLMLFAIRRGRKLFGLCVPAGADWLALLPGALLGGVAGGAWIFDIALIPPQTLLQHHWSEWAVLLGFPLVAELLFRSLLHGTLAQRFATQYSGGPWFLSWPVFISSVLYALWSLPQFLPFFSPGVELTFAAALLFGISSGMARERSESVLPCLLMHWSCLLVLVLTLSLF